MNERVITLTERDLEALIEKAVARALLNVGIVAKDEKTIEETRRDLFFLRDLRRAKESIIGKAVAAIITVIVGGFCVILISGFRHLR